MSIQPYESSKGAEEQDMILYQNTITPEEAEKRARDAEELDAKIRDIMENVPDREYFLMGSNAGANSSTFDLYRHSKSREMKRLRAMEEEALAEERNAAFKESMETKNAEEESKTAARRAKRLKQKEKKKQKKKKEAGVENPNTTPEHVEKAQGQHAQKKACVEPELD
ncbi:hypothetical protein PSENEW3n2_00002180 [Picochlorum sp. SENEW3]|nr:hypothetical protein PSENEW3n2_00002180 [Picochlorum sp. SENEW3]WPT15816.1 hypothetical protein PSENEW3_00002180 [Picochlorum sp. SENEW3]